jgi:hypothetical protein
VEQKWTEEKIFELLPQEATVEAEVCVDPTEISITKTQKVTTRRIQIQDE